jgi:agmatine/peptidylarginine deiminase
MESRTQPLEKVIYPELWNGISLTCERKGSGIAKSTYIVSPGSDAGQISLRYNVPVRLDKAGKLVFEFETGKLSETAPVAWQIINGERFAVEVEFCRHKEKMIGFKVGEYNPAYRLIIDPEWEWNTFMGSWHSDKGYGIAVDGNGNVYITGLSKATWGSPVNAYAGDSDAFAAKLNSSGVLQWNTFMGGSSDDEGYGIVVDGSGNVYVAGYSYATWGSPVNPHAGSEDVFAAKLNSSGVLQWNTFMGDSDRDYGNGIAVDSSGNVYVAGYSYATWGSPVNAHAGEFDIFAAKLNSSGIRQWNTFMGDSDSDMGRSIAIDGSGNVYVAGYSYATWGSPVNAFAGYFDAFAAKLNSSGVRQWHTFMGGSSWDYGMSIAVNGSGNVYVAGYSNATWGSPVNAHAGSEDVFAAELNSSGMLQWHTFMGGSSKDNGGSITIDYSGDVYVAGYSDTTWGSPVNAHAGYFDVFAAKLNSSGVRQGNTFMGCSILDDGGSIAVDGSGNVYVAGESGATWGSPVNAHAGLSDAFAVKFDYSNIVKVEIDLGLPTEFKFSQNYPNPFNSNTTIQFALPRTIHVSIMVYNALGLEVVTLMDKNLPPGQYKTTWNAADFASGVYLYRIQAGDFVETKKLLLLK